MPHFDFIEIGTSDFGTLIARAGPTVRGLSVEPIQEYLGRLPSPPCVTKVCAAVSDVSGSMLLYYIPDDVRILHGLPSWMKGTNKIGEPHPTVLRYLQRKGLSPELIHTRTVPLITFHQLLTDYDVTSLDVLKIDTEGHDVYIMKTVIDCIEAGRILPASITFESNNLSDRAAVLALHDRLTQLGYSVTQTKTDTHARLSTVA